MKPLYSRFSRILLTAVLVITLNISVKAQTTLSMGDIAFTGYRSADATDNFSFVLLVPVQANTVINFTDNGWLSPGSWRGGETVITLTTLALPAGREILISGTTATQAGSGASAGAVTGTALSLSTSGDQIIAYQGASTLISGIHMNVATIAVGLDCADTDNTNWDGTCSNSSNASWKPPVFNNAGTSAVWIGTFQVSTSEKDNAKFVNTNGDPLLTVAQVKAAILNQANWQTSDGSPGVPAFTLPTNLTYLLPPLAVSLVSFTGKLNSDKTITLQWKAAVQQDIQEYIVERSANGSDFIQVGTVAAGGNVAIANYTFIDRQPLTGNNYYRLKTIELSAKHAYSDVVMVNLKSDIKVNVYPNPVTDNLTIQQFGFARYKSASLFNGNGNLLQQITLNSLQQTVNMKIYPARIYIVKMDDGTVFKVVKQ